MIVNKKENYYLNVIKSKTKQIKRQRKMQKSKQIWYEKGLTENEKKIKVKREKKVERKAKQHKQ